MKDYLADQGKTDNVTSGKHFHAGGLWADGIGKAGVFRHPNLPLFFSLAVFFESSHSPSIVVLPPIGGGMEESDTQTVIISPLEIGRRLCAFWCTLISVIAYIF